MFVCMFVTKLFKPIEFRKIFKTIIENGLQTETVKEGNTSSYQ